MESMNSMFDYILSHFYSVYSIDQNVKIHYGYTGENGVLIAKYSGNFFKEKKPHPQDITWHEWNGKNIPFLFGSDRNDILKVGENTVQIEQDIIAGAFYFLSGWQEYHCNNRDHHDRFPYSESIQKKLNIVTVPVVNYYFDILKTAIEIAYNIELKRNYDIGTKTCICLTHDVDHCKSAWKIGGMDAIKKWNFITPWKLLLMKLFIKDAWFNFDEVLSIEERFNARSTFFFIPVQGKLDGLPNADYDVNSQEIKTIFSNIDARGFEIAIHGSFGTSTNLSQLSKELKKMPHVYGNRFHFLKWDTLLSGGVIEKAALRYDSTLGFAEHIGFRHSYCFPFRPFDHDKGEAFKFLEIPLNVMDTTYWLKDYMGLEKSEIPESLRSLFTEVDKFGGCMTLLWHNNTFSKYKYAGWKEIYIGFLEYCKNNHAVFHTAGDLLTMFSNLLDKD